MEMKVEDLGLFKNDPATRGTFNGLTLIENDNFNEQVKELHVYAIKDGDNTPFYNDVVLVNDGKGNFTYKDESQAKEWPNDGKGIIFYVATEGVLSCSGTTVSTNVSTSTINIYDLKGNKITTSSKEQMSATLKQLPKGIYIAEGKKYIVR